MNIKISSIFNSIQGEGRHCGFPVTFLRVYTEKCFPNGNRCSFCDTINQHHYKDNEIDLLKSSIPNKRIVITGGEPFSIDLQLFRDLLIYLKNKGHEIDIETNGAYLCQYQVSQSSYSIMDDIFRMTDQLTISPKLNVNYEYDYQFHRELNNVFNEKIDYKFVVSNISSFRLVEDFIAKVKILKQNVFLMAQTPTTVEWKKQVVEECIKKEWNYSPRLHLDVWGDVNYEV